MWIQLAAILKQIYIYIKTCNCGSISFCLSLQQKAAKKCTVLMMQIISSSHWVMVIVIYIFNLHRLWNSDYSVDKRPFRGSSQLSVPSPAVLTTTTTTTTLENLTPLFIWIFIIIFFYLEPHLLNRLKSPRNNRSGK